MDTLHILGNWLSQAPIAIFIELLGTALGVGLILRLGTVQTRLEQTATVPAELRAQAYNLHRQIESLSLKVAASRRLEIPPADRAAALAIYRDL